MTFYERHNNGDFTRAPDVDLARQEGLPAGIYDLIPTPIGIRLRPIGTVKPLPKRIYGNARAQAARIIATYLDRKDNNVNTGVQMTGLKGSGKSLTASLVINELVAKHNAVAINVDIPLSGDDIQKLIGSTDQLIVLNFDEYDKVYATKEKDSDRIQNSLLTFLSGGMCSGVLSLISVNDPSYINPYMKDRPGRVFYNFHYYGLTRSVIREFAKECLNDKTQVESFVRKISRIDKVSFDILTSMVEDMNRFSTTVDDSMEAMGYGNRLGDRFSRVIYYKNKNVSVAYDNAGTYSLTSDSFYYDLDHGAVEQLGVSDKNPNGLDKAFLKSLPESFKSKGRLHDMVRLGDTGLYIAPNTESQDIVVVWYDKSVCDVLDVTPILRELGYTFTSSRAATQDRDGVDVYGVDPKTEDLSQSADVIEAPQAEEEIMRRHEMQDAHNRAMEKRAENEKRPPETLTIDSLSRSRGLAFGGITR